MAMNTNYLFATTELWASIAVKTADYLTDYVRDAKTQSKRNDDPLGLGQVYTDALENLSNNMSTLYQHQVGMATHYTQLQTYAMAKLCGLSPDPVVQPRADDRRFMADDWQDILFFDLLRQSYLIASNGINNCTQDCSPGDSKQDQKLRFFTQLFTDALAPSNYASTNPQVVSETISTGGVNLLRGYSAMLDDLKRGKGQLSPRMTDSSPFELGKNIASTEGSVVYQNDMIQLLQYAPSTEQVYQRPLLIVPPWINKYYILDLRKENSYIRWAVEQGHTVFVISWVNPDESYADKTMDDYLTDGVLAALEAIEQATGEEKVNAVGYCLGGTLLACANGYLSAKGDERIASSTYFTALIDFSEPGDLGIFIDEEQLDAIDEIMQEEGYLDGGKMSLTFNMLRANDLIWPFIINNYLLGKTPPSFDLLYWNCDNTRMPAAMHSGYLRNMYLHNRLREPGGISINGTAIDLSKIKTPNYFISTKDDHISPWEATFSGAKLFGGPTRFVLGESGHIAGIVNHPRANKYGYWTGKAPKGKAQTWFKNTNHAAGSWWGDWQTWVSKHNSKQVNARQPGDGKLNVLEEAPGSYVKVNINNQ